MRSTIFTSLIAVLSMSGTSFAEGGPQHGCYARDYTDAHLANHPDQIVDRMVIYAGPAWYTRSQGGDDERPTWMKLALWTADQGHVRENGQGGQRFDQALVCGENEKGHLYCAVECDGGSMNFQRDDGDVLQFETSYLIVGKTDSCGGVVDLAEYVGQLVSYRLERVPDTVCTQTFSE